MLALVVDKHLLGLVNWLLIRLLKVAQFVRLVAVHLCLAVLLLLLGLHFQHLYRVLSVRSAAGRVQGALVQIESSQRLYLLTSNPDSLRKYSLYRKVLAARLAELCQLIPANPANQNICRSIQRLITMKLLEMQTTVEMVRLGNMDAAVTLVRSNIGAEYEDEIERQLDLIRLREGVNNGSPSACLINQ